MKGRKYIRKTHCATNRGKEIKEKISLKTIFQEFIANTFFCRKSLAKCYANAMLDFDLIQHYEQDSFDNSWLPVRHKGLWENDERGRQSEKGVMLQAGKTDYSDCRRVRLAGWATQSF